MTDKNVWLVTAPAGAWASTSPGPRSPPATLWSRPPATPASITEALGEHEDLLAVALDVTDPTPPKPPYGPPSSGSVTSTCS